MCFRCPRRKTEKKRKISVQHSGGGQGQMNVSLNPDSSSYCEERRQVLPSPCDLSLHISHSHATCTHATHNQAPDHSHIAQFPSEVNSSWCGTSLALDIPLSLKLLERFCCQGNSKSHLEDNFLPCLFLKTPSSTPAPKTYCSVL